ncbi:hypothetical protein CG736_20475 [Kitasatospora sp. CB02891]|nr:hypothetical protein CG736_20475 [Kitasatospora sp. CB02891]
MVKAKATGQRVVVDSLTTEFSETSATPDGHFAFTAHPDQQRVKRDGGWAALDASLVRTADGSWAPKSAAGGVVLSPGGKGPLATMTSADGKKLALSAPFDLPTPQLDDSGTGLLYPNVIPDVDLKVTAGKYGGMSTVLVVKTQEAAVGQALKSLKFSTEADGVTVTADKDGTLSAKAADGKPRWTAPAPRMWDSATQAAQSRSVTMQAASSTGDGRAVSSVDGPGTSAAVATMPVAADASGLTLTPSQDLLAHGTAPYYIDPAWLPWNTGASAWTWVQSAHATDSGNYMRSGSSDNSYPGVGVCGTYPQGNSCIPADVYRSFFQFDTRPLRGTVINSAQVDLQEYVSANFDCSKTYPLDLFLTGSISNGTNWNNQPGKVGGSLDGSRWIGGSGHTGCYNNVGFNYNVSGALQQYGPTYDYLTFGLYGNESDAYGFKRVSSPMLSITYDRAPNPPANPGVYPAPRTVSPAQSNQACGNGDSTTWAWLGAGSAQAQAVALTATVSSPTQAQVKTWNHIWDYNLPGVPDIASGYSDFVGNGSTASWWLAGGTLKDGHAYGWSMFSTDGLDGVGWGGPTPTCYFKVDLTPPTLTFPATVADPSTQFPSSGNGQVTTLRAGQSGYVPFTATDPNPSGLNTSGVTCLRWSFDPQFSSNGDWKCGSAMPAGKIPVTPGRWGTNVLYVQAQDNAGNISPVGQYTFYVPWNPNGPAPVYGDVNADPSRTPDVITAGPSGDLRAYTTPATGPQNSVAATTGQSPGGDSWANYRTTHRGSLRNGPDVDDLIAHKDGDPKLWVYKNPGNTGVNGVFDTKVELAKPACVVTAANPDCTGYAATWSGTLQIAAIGDPASTDRSIANHAQNRTGLVTTETDPSGNAALWYYPSAVDNSFANPVRLAATGWKDRDLISPGDWAGQSRPGLWARNRITGDVTAHTFTVTTVSSTDTNGITITYPVATGISAGKTAATGITAAAWPRIGSDGDLTGNGAPSLWGITSQGVLQTWTGTRTGTTTDPGFTATGPNTAFDLGTVAFDSSANAAAHAAIEDGTYPGAQNVLATTGASLIRGDGRITTVPCDAPHQITVTAASITLPQNRICFVAPGSTGYLALNIPDTTRLETTGRSVKAGLTTDGAAQSVDVAAGSAVNVGAAAKAGSKSTLQELRITGPAGAPSTAQNDPALAFNAQLAIGDQGRTCSGALVDPLWVLAAKSCFSDNPANPVDVTAGAPKSPTTAIIGRTDLGTVGGHTASVVEIVPHADRDVVLARLSRPAPLAPIAVSTTAPTAGESLQAAGFGRTATQWAPGTLHTAAFTVGAVGGSGFDLAAKNPASLVCKGDAGGPTWRTENGKPALTGVISRSWQGGCRGANSTETRTGAYQVRVDDLGSWIASQSGRAYEILNPASGRCLNLTGAGPTWANGTAVIAWDCIVGADNEKFRLTSDGQLRNPASNRCLQVSGTGPTWANGTAIVLWDCVAGAGNEKFEWTGDGQLRNPASGRCLNLTGAGPTWANGTPIALWDCVAGAATQQFQVVADDQIPRPVGQLRNPASGRCLNVSGAGPTWPNFTPIILWDCKGDPNERFQLTAEGWLYNQTSNRCVNISGAGPVWDNGTPVILWDCIADAGNEKFEWTADGQLRNPASNRCLNVSGAGPVWDNGTSIILWDCKGDNNEKFQLAPIKA